MINTTELQKKLYPVLSSGALIRIAGRVLYHINREINRHTERTSFLVMKMADYCGLKEENAKRNLVFLSLFHTLGFFREDMVFNYNPYTSTIDYFTNTPDVESKYIFASYYLEFMTPIHKDARALENFTAPFNKSNQQTSYLDDYKSIIYLCARVSDFVYKNPDRPLPENLDDLAPGMMNPKYIEIFTKLNAHHTLEDYIRDEEYLTELLPFVGSMEFSKDECIILEKLMVYLLDLKSTVTMSHSINTSCYALSIASRKGLNIDELSILFSSAILHDIGKIVTPQRILEYPGKLSPEDMGIMRYHVNHSKRILKGLVSDEILQNVFRHHEKLNGSGYPQQLTGDQLTLTQRILTIADITSALCDSRSYKGEFSKEKVLSIMKKMTEEGELDPELMDIVEENFDDIHQELPLLQQILKVDFSYVLTNYNEYILNHSSSVQNNSIEDIEEIEELDDVEELE